uniref:Metallo-beta-lactamase domain-containing protein n=1 Tax=Setaria digitata TaxID=48799 RepID=A0A915PWE0_9BILA
MHLYRVPTYLCAIHEQYVKSAKTEQLRHWLEENRNSLPQPISDDLLSSISSSSEIAAAILKIFDLTSEPEVLEAQFTRTTILPTTSSSEGKVADREVCPFGADPLVLSGKYSYCKSTTIGDCPAGFICDFSAVLGRPICCKNMRQQPIISIKVNPAINSTLKPRSTVASSRRGTMRTPQYIWSSTKPNHQSPWYIRERTTTTFATAMPKNELAATESGVKTDSKETSEEYVNVMSKTVVTPTVEQEESSHRNTSNEFLIDSVKSLHTIVQQSLTPSVPIEHSVSVSLIQAGNIKRLTNKQMLIVGAITLINDRGYRILVDTGSSADTESLLQGLSKEMVSIDEIAVVVITSANPSHIGNLNLFPSKPILFHTMEYVEQHAIVSELKDRPYRKVTENIEVWKTPGRTQQSLSVLVYNVEGYGTIAVVGDLIPMEDYIFNKADSSIDLDESVWDSLIRRQNSNLIVCLADWIIPGHGQPFRVLPHYRQRAGCTGLLAQKEKFSKT